MKTENIVPTMALIEWLSSCNDDGSPPLVAVALDGAVYVNRYDGSEPTASEAAHIRGVLAAHAVSPLSTPSD